LQNNYKIVTKWCHN